MTNDTTPAPIGADARLIAVARAIWALMREHEDRCDRELEDVLPHHPVWAYAAAAIASAAHEAADDDDATSREQYERMFHAACADLGAINEALGLDPDDGGADPILAAIEELRISAALAIAAAPKAEPVQPERVPLTDAARDVLAERQRQISAEGWTPEHDDKHSWGELARAGAAYAAQSLAAEDAELECGPPYWWPWERKWWKPTSRRRMLVKAGALILAEIERLDRAAAHGIGIKKGEGNA